MNALYEALKAHVGHRVEIAQYGNGDNFALEDLDTDEVIFDTDIYDLTANEESTLECEETLKSFYVEDTIVVHRYGVNDYSVYYKNGDCSTRGTFIDILNDMDDYFAWNN